MSRKRSAVKRVVRGRQATKVPVNVFSFVVQVADRRLGESKLMRQLDKRLMNWKVYAHDIYRLSAAPALALERAKQLVDPAEMYRARLKGEEDGWNARGAEIRKLRRALGAALKESKCHCGHPAHSGRSCGASTIRGGGTRPCLCGSAR